MPAWAFSADFTVSPVNVFFDNRQKTSLITITNNSDQPLTLQVSTVAWSQDEDGKDIYTPSDDIIVFPKIFTINKEEKRLVRIGIKTPASSSEKTYRIYMEEIQTKERPLKGAVVTNLMKVGVPVFVAPLKSSPEGRLENTMVSKGNLSFLISNRGNIHFIPRNIKTEGFDKEGGQIFQNELTSWYILSGRSTKIGIKIPHDICVKLASMKIDVSADILSLKESVRVLPEMCSP